MTVGQAARRAVKMAVVPEAPLAILVPVLALLVAGGLLYRRRRRLG